MNAHVQSHPHTHAAGSKIPSESNQALINSGTLIIKVSHFSQTLKKDLKEETWLILSHKDPTGKLLKSCFCWKTSGCTKQRTQREQQRDEAVTVLQKPTPFSAHS